MGLILLLLACAPTQRAKGLEPAASTLEALRAAREPRAVAVVVGVDTYTAPQFPDLKHAGADADAVAAHLASPAGGYDRVDLRRDATRADVLAALRALADTAHRDDTVVVYFSGHGTRVKDGEAWRRFLLVADSDPGDLEGTAIDLADVQAWLGTLPALRKTLIVDACFDGDGRSVVRPADRAEDAGSAAPPTSSMGPGEAHLFATSAGRPSREDDRLGHGIYTYHLLDAASWSRAEADLDADGAITVWEAHDWARSRTMERTDGVQVPEAVFRIVGTADVLLAGDRAASDRALVYLYPREREALDGARLQVDGRDRGVLPGTVPVAPGHHHVLLTDRDGRLVVDGWLTLAEGRSYSLDDVARLAQGPKTAVRARAVRLAIPPLDQAVGGGLWGAELDWSWRRNRGVGRGWGGDVLVGVGQSPSRPAARRGRAGAWTGVHGGYQDDAGRLRWRVGWGVSLTWLPPSPLDEPAPPGTDPWTVPAEAGWLVAATGPRASLGWVLPRGWTVDVGGRTHGAVLDLGTGPRVVPLVTGSVGVGLAR